MPTLLLLLPLSSCCGDNEDMDREDLEVPVVLINPLVGLIIVDGDCHAVANTASPRTAQSILSGIVADGYADETVIDFVPLSHNFLSLCIAVS